MTTSVAVGSQTLGCSVPPSTEHAIIPSLPTWRDNVGLMERETRVLKAMTLGYPRFYPHTSIQRLEYICEQKFATNGDNCALYPSRRAAEECRKFLLDRAAHLGASESVKLVQYSICPEDSPAQTRQLAELHIALYPADMHPSLIEFWRHTGLGISSRFAEYCLSLLPINGEDDRQDPHFPSGLTHCQSIVPSKSDANSKDRGMCLEEHSSGAFAKHILRGRIAGLISGSVQNASESCTAGSELDAGNESTTRGIQVVHEDDVYLFQTGMAAIWNAHQVCLRVRPLAKIVSFGLPYVDTVGVLEGWGAGVLHFGNGRDSDINALEKFLAEQSGRNPTKAPILALFTEVPSNPLLGSPDMPRLRVLADMYDFLLIIDDTIGSLVNVEVLPYADIVVTSLTKIFSGAANVMGGSLVFNSKGRHYAALKSHMMAIYEDVYFDEDAVVMERNSRDVVQRVHIIDENTEALCAFLHSRSAAEGAPSAVLKEVYYPKYVTPANYLRCKRHEGGYGGLFSLTFTSLAASMAFYDALPCYKGPSLGTNFTLACAYTVLAFHEELEWAAQHGLEEGLVRVSVGMEERDWLLCSFETALNAAESAQ